MIYINNTTQPIAYFGWKVNKYRAIMLGYNDLRNAVTLTTFVFQHIKCGSSITTPPRLLVPVRSNPRYRGSDSRPTGRTRTR